MIYVGVFVGLLFLRFSLGGQPRLRNQVYYLVLAAVFVFSAFRFEVGCDWSGYLNQYYWFSRLPLAAIWHEREPLWVGIFWLQAWLDLPYPWINVFSSVIFFAGAHAMARRQPDPLAFLILLFPVLIINLPMSGIRQGAAIGVMTMAFMAFNDRRPIRFVMLTVIASGLHSSALVFLLLAPLATGQISRNRLVFAAVMAIPGSLILMSGEAAELATTRYVNTGVDAAGAAFRVGVIGLTAVYFFLLFRRHWAQVFPNDYHTVLIGAVLMLGMLALIPISTVIADRLAYYLIPIQAMIIARIPFLPVQREKVLKAGLPYLVLLALLMVWTAYSSLFQQCYVPYNSWLFGFPTQSRFTF